MTFSINRPAEGHRPSVYRSRRGNSPVFNRPLYGTNLDCQCGYRIKSNEPPSKGGRAVVNRLYRQHLSSEGFFS